MGRPRYQQTPASAGRLFALSHDLMGALDLDGRLVWANPAWEVVVGRDPAALAGTPYLELLHPDDRERALAVQAELAGGQTERPELEVRLRTSSGEDRHILFNAVYSPDERLLYISGKDVTELREQERGMAARTAELERSNAELAQFAYVASHDLSEPLRMVSSYLQLLRRRYQGRLDDDADAFIDYAVEGADRMRVLIEDLLAYSRAGRSERPLEPVNTARVVGEVAATLRALADGEPPEIEFGALPNVQGDPQQLVQLFQNLIGNAVKFVAPGVRPRVIVTAERADGAWRFAIEDNGIGIEPRYAERVFGMFQRLHTREEFEGTGIGLAIARKVVERHGGWISAVPRETGGTCFTFTLPAVGGA